MHYVLVLDSVVTDQCQINPYDVFSQSYASNFIEAPDEVTFGWSLINGEWVAPYVPPPDYVEINKQQAQGLLQQTDWTATVDINNPQYSNPYLGNQDAFLAYRSQVRQIAINPPSTPAIFPDIPEEIWITV